MKAIAAVVPAAGRSSRMGRPKALLDYRGRSFVAHIVAELGAAGVAPVVVVHRPGDGAVLAECARAGAVAVVNSCAEAGMLSSVLAGLEALSDRIDGFVLWPVDVPAASARTVRALLAEHARGEAPIVVPCHGGRRGHPVLFAAATFAELRAAPPAEGARAVVRARGDEVALVEVDEPGILRDVDRPADLASL